MEPEFLNRPYSGEIFIFVRRLYEISSCLKPVGARLIFFAIAAAHHDDRHAFQLGIGLDRLQHFQPIDLRQVEIEKHLIRRRGFRVVTRSFQESHGFLPIRNHRNTAMDEGIPERNQRQVNVGAVVLHQQYVQASVCVRHPHG